MKNSRWNWRVAEKAEFFRRKVRYPTIERLRVRQAIGELHLRSWENILFWNPFKDVDGAYQWLEFVVNYNSKPFVLLFKAGHRKGGAKPYEKQNLAYKEQFLKERKIPYAILHRGYTTQEYMFAIRKAFLKVQGAVEAERSQLLHPA